MTAPTPDLTDFIDALAALLLAEADRLDTAPAADPADDARPQEVA
jgi:hypothetical protein